MSLRDDPNYFPQPDVPSDGNYTGNFGRELLYYGYSPRSAAVDAANAAAGPKTATSGKYAFDPATGQYTWVPAGSTVKTDTAADYKSGLGGVEGAGGRGADGIGGSTAGSFGQSAQGFLNTPLGTGLAYALSPLVNAFSPLRSKDEAAKVPVVDLVGTPTNPASDTPDPGTGLQGQGSTGQTGLYGDAAAGSGLSTASDSAFGDSGDGAWASGGLTALASGGLGSLGSYSDGGRLLRGPGDGVSDSIPATIGKVKRPARLADGEFVVPARIVSELGNGSTEAGARKLYAMLDRIQKGRSKSVGKGKVAVNSRMDKHLPA